jgi:hypothetical protein
VGGFSSIDELVDWQMKESPAAVVQAERGGAPLALEAVAAPAETAMWLVEFARRSFGWLI